MAGDNYTCLTGVDGLPKHLAVLSEQYLVLLPVSRRFSHLPERDDSFDGFRVVAGGFGKFLFAECLPAAGDESGVIDFELMIIVFQQIQQA